MSLVLFEITFQVLPNTEGASVPLRLTEVEFNNTVSVYRRDGVLTVLPSATLLLPNYPNPFNPDTWIPYQLSEDTPVTIRIFDTTGQLVRELRLGNQRAGVYVNRAHAAYWDGCNDVGEAVASGVYFYRLETPDYQQMRRMVIVR